MLTLKKGSYSGQVCHATSKEGLTACITNYNIDHYIDSLHCHENAHFSFMIEGGCVEQRIAACELVPGNVSYYTAGEKHRVVKVARTSRRINIELDDQFFRNYDVRDNEARNAACQNPDTKFLMVKVYKELMANEPISAVTIQMTLLQLLNQTNTWDKAGQQEQWVKRVDEYLRGCSDESVTLLQLAILANLHPVTLSKKFPQYFGCTLGEYKRKLKIEKSLGLIKNSALSLTEVALECGFYDQNHFIRTFKSLTGFLPLGYRKS